jgi:thiamine biosynthesis protein ThiC
MNMDYAICQALNYQMDHISLAIILYDVACQWFIHFLERVRQAEYLNIPDDMEIIAGVGKFHLSAHVQECFAKHSPNFIEGAGQVDGEILETLWSVFNTISKSARTGSESHRREIYDDHMRDSNWKKLVESGESVDNFCNAVSNFCFH